MENNNGSLVTLDALIPAEMAAKAEQIGVKKAHANVISMFVLAVLAGAFISLGAIFSTTVTAGSGDAMPYGITYDKFRYMVEIIFYPEIPLFTVSFAWILVVPLVYTL